MLPADAKRRQRYTYISQEERMKVKKKIRLVTSGLLANNNSDQKEIKKR